MGARPLLRAIQRLIEDPLADFVLGRELTEGSTIVVDRREDAGPGRSEGRDARDRGRGPARARHGAAGRAAPPRRRVGRVLEAPHPGCTGSRTPGARGVDVPSSRRRRPTAARSSGGVATRRNAAPPARAVPRRAAAARPDVPFLTDGGLETTLIFHDGLDLPHFAAYDLLTREGGEDALRRYFEPYVGIARERGVGIVLETPTWRASPDWAERLGHSPDELVELNRRAVALLEACATSSRPPSRRSSSRAASVRAATATSSATQ